MATHHILLAIDGSGSEDWRRPDGFNSHVYRFYLDFLGRKEYLHGPSKFGLGESSGNAVGTIIDNGVMLIYRMIGETLREHKSITIDDIKINLVGHSRGAFIAAKIANILQNPLPFIRPATYGDERVRLIKNNTGNSRTLDAIKVNFLGLYDFVDMTAQVGAADVGLKNVVYVAHAQRIKSDNFSRVSFKATDIPKAILKPLDISHGGIGGDPGFFNEVKVGNDLYCNARHLVSKNSLGSDKDSTSSFNVFSIVKGIADASYAGYWNPTKNTLKDIKNFHNNSKEADAFIRDEADKRGRIVFSGTSIHLPFSYNDMNVYKELKALAGF